MKNPKNSGTLSAAKAEMNPIMPSRITITTAHPFSESTGSGDGGLKRLASAVCRLIFVLVEPSVGANPSDVKVIPDAEPFADPTLVPEL
jgi:hypothetical protein